MNIKIILKATIQFENFDVWYQMWWEMDWTGNEIVE